jgi:hypothetical protein
MKQNARTPDDCVVRAPVSCKFASLMWIYVASADSAHNGAGPILEGVARPKYRSCMYVLCKKRSITFCLEIIDAELNNGGGCTKCKLNLLLYKFTGDFYLNYMPDSLILVITLGVDLDTYNK